MKDIPYVKDKNLLQNINAYRKDPLGFMKGAFDKYGDTFGLRFVNRNIIFTQNPNISKRVLQGNHRGYTKAAAYRKLKILVGEGLFTADGATWLRNRRIAQPAFHKKSIAVFIQIMIDATNDMLDQCWEQFAEEGKTFQLQEEMTECTLAIVCEALLGKKIDSGGQVVNEELAGVLDFLIKRMLSPINLPLWVPLSAHKKFKYSENRMSELIRTIIEEKQKGDLDDSLDLLTMLLLAKDEESGNGLNTQQLVDEILTFFLAGHETSAMALSWLFYYLGKYPEVEQKVRDEIDQVLGGKPISAETLNDFTYTKQVVNEVLRLCPPLWVLSRECLKDDELDGFSIEKGDSIVLSVFWMHRNEKLWKDPEKFNPDRFSDSLANEEHKYAYIPFGGGPRICIGYHFALNEMIIILVGALQRFRMKLIEEEEKEFECSLTLRPKDGIQVSLQKV